MENYSHIYDPHNGRKYDLMGQEGSKLLKKLVLSFKKGGSKQIKTQVDELLTIFQLPIFVDWDNRMINGYLSSLIKENNRLLQLNNKNDLDLENINKLKTAIDLISYYKDNIIDTDNENKDTNLKKKIQKLSMWKLLALQNVDVGDTNKQLIIMINNLLYLTLDEFYQQSMILINNKPNELSELLENHSDELKTISNKDVDYKISIELKNMVNNLFLIN